MSNKTQRPEVRFRRIVGKIGRFTGSSTLYLVISRMVNEFADRALSSVDVTQTTVAVTATQLQARAQNASAFRTTVSNTGLSPVWVYENDALVMILDSLESRDMPMPGRGAISLKTREGTSSVKIATHTYDL